MALEDKTLKLCTCNETLPLDPKALAQALKSATPITLHTELCRREVQSFTSALKDDECVVGCTQEAALFSDLAEEAGSKSVLKFVNIREMAGWSDEGRLATPKIAALLALADAPEPDPVAGVSFKSGGQLLVIGPAEAALGWAERLSGDLDVSVLILGGRSSRAELPAERNYPVWSGKVTSVAGWLGAFEVAWRQENPIDLDVCTRCNACIRACPEAAIDYSYQINLDKCRSHRQCVKACGAIGAIDFDRKDTERRERFDLVLDLSPTPMIRVPQPPQGYFAPGADPLEQALAAVKLARLVGEFEKPRFTSYNERICAHGRSGKFGCTQCIDTCSTGAITSAGDKVVVEPHLCMGCGGCASVCPSGAMTHLSPRVADLGARFKRMLGVYRDAGGKDACLLLHSGGESRALLHRIGRRAGKGGKAVNATKGAGLPARVIPFEVLHPASIGIDTLLGAVAYGAGQVLLLVSEAENAEYGDAMRGQIGHAQTILNALGYAGTHFRVLTGGGAESIVALDRELRSLAPAATVVKPAVYNLSPEKRTTLEFAIDHLARLAPAPKDEIALGRGAPYGRIEVDKSTCTMCLACVGACPESALLDSPEAPRLRFIERNCVQCGLCANTCPEHSIALKPRLLLTAAAKEAVTLNEAVPFKCVRCGKPFGVKNMIDAMVARLNTHSMFTTGPALRRLQMCADCRVIDMMENANEARITEVKR